MNKKRNDKESMICLTLKPSQTFFVYRIQSKEKNLTKELFKKKGKWRIEEKHQEGFLTALAMAIKKDPRNVNKKVR